MPKSSTNETDGFIWQVVGLPLGERGMDSRRPSEPDTLVDALNARFLDAKTIARRDGHTGYKVQDKGAFASDNLTVTDEWVYGHGLVAYDEADPNNVKDNHYPLAGKAMGTFETGSKSVVWTGDRLIREDKVGSHELWGDQGIPAYLPQQIDVPYYLSGGNHMDTCLTETYEVTAVTRTVGVDVSIKDRVNGSLLFRETVGTLAVSRVRVVNSGGALLLFRLDTAGFYVTRWLGDQWGHESLIDFTATTFDVAEAPDGCEVIWDNRESTPRLRLGGFVGDSPGTTHAWGATAYTGSGYPPSDVLSVAVAVAPNGDIAYAWTSDGNDTTGGLLCHSDDPTVSHQTTDVTLLHANTSFVAAGLVWGKTNEAVTITYRGLSSGDDSYDYTVYASHAPHEDYFDSADYTTAWRVNQGRIAGNTPLSQTEVFTARLLSKAFTVGNEVFAWLYSTASNTAFLIGNDEVPQVCGIADREVVERRGSPVTLRSVQKDPLSDTKFVWSRGFNAGEYFRRGDIRIGYLDFLPKLSTARFGAGTYLAGSHVRVWDGIELGDAGFHDYPAVKSLVDAGSGSVDAGIHYIRVYPVRYTSQGERFQGPAVTYPAAPGFTSAGGGMTLTLHTLPVTNHDDVKFEVYMTPVGSTVFRYAGVIDNDKTVPTVSVILTSSDVELEAAPADPHAPGVDDLQEMEEFGPTGCAILETSGDRLWGIGGQVPAGCAQFSKLYEVGEGAGFGDLINTQIFDASGAELTSIASFSDSALVAFQRNRYYSLLGPGPDNFGQGNFNVPELRVSAGAISHWGTIVTPVGVMFWSEEGPRAITGNFQTQYIGEAVAPTTATMEPSGVRMELDRGEVIWYTEEGAALLYNFIGRVGRFARWTGVPTAGVSDKRIVTPKGECWTPESTPRDYGRTFVFSFETGNIRLERLLQGGLRVRHLGMTGKWLGEHTVKFRVFYDGGPEWLERVKWTPGDGSLLTLLDTYGSLTPAQFDALDIVDKSGRYDTLFRVGRQDCEYIRVKVSDSGAYGFIPWELTFEMASKNGLTRIAAQRLNRNGE